MRQFRILAAACGLALALTTASPVLAGAVAEAQVATVKSGSNLRSQPTTASPILAELPAGTTVDIICWAYGEPTYGTDAYGSMWLYASLGGWVHSFLVTPVEVGPCAAAGYGFYSGRIPSAGGFANCDQAIMAGAAPMFAGEAGYDPHLDRDGDGIACEWDD